MRKIWNGHLWPSEIFGAVSQNDDGILSIHWSVFRKRLPVICIGDMDKDVLNGIYLTLQWHAEGKDRWVAVLDKTHEYCTFRRMRRESLDTSFYVSEYRTHDDLPGALIIRTLFISNTDAPTIILLPKSWTGDLHVMALAMPPPSNHRTFLRNRLRKKVPTVLVDLIIKYAYNFGIEEWVKATQ